MNENLNKTVKDSMVELTPYQAIFYYEWLLDPNRYDYNLNCDTVIEGGLSLEKLNSAFVRYCNEHYLFNCNIAEDGDKLYWKRREPLSPDVQYVEYYDKPLCDDEIFAIMSKPFDLKNDLLYKFHVIKLSDNRFRILLRLSHIIMDGAVALSFFEEFRDYYNDPKHFCAVDLEKQRFLCMELTEKVQAVIRENREGMESFWRGYCQNACAVDLTFLKLSGNKQDGIDPISPVSLCHFSLSREYWDKIRLVSKKLRVTPYIYAQVVLALFLHFMTGQKRVSFAFPITIPEGSALLYGSQVNNQIITFSFDGETTVADLVRQAKDFFCEVKARKAKYLPINKIRSFIKDGGVFNTAFALTLRNAYYNFDGVSKETLNDRFYLDLTSDLLVLMEEQKDALQFWFRYKNRVLDGGLIKTNAAKFQRLLINVTDSLISEL
jgi:hypothetical protein